MLSLPSAVQVMLWVFSYRSSVQCTVNIIFSRGQQSKKFVVHLCVMMKVIFVHLVGRRCAEEDNVQ